MRRIIAATVLIVLAASACGGTEKPPETKPPETEASGAESGRCTGPGYEGYEIWDVSTEPYEVDNEVDENGNGQVCALPLDETFEDDNGETHQIYDFIDDVV